jgi:hypothetical protein
MSEQTQLSPAEERAFQAWARKNGIRDVDAPESRYDYRGYWKNVASGGGDQTKQYDDGLHFPDTYKQHGHPTFSIESQYSAGPFDGGRWLGEDFVPPGADLMMNSRGQSRLDPQALSAAILALAKGLKNK